jgi:hypothetical protein
MKRIVGPLRLRMHGLEVANLQDTLREFLERRIILAEDELARRELSRVLERERTTKTSGGSIRSEYVSHFQFKIIQKLRSCPKQSEFLRRQHAPAAHQQTNDNL